MFTHPGQSLKWLISGHPATARRGFTLVELLVSATLLLIITGIVLQITNQTSQVWRSSNAKIQAFQEARAAFESLTRRIGQATLNTYQDYYDNSSPPQLRTPANASSFVPHKYDRASDLHFICGQSTTLLKDAADLKNRPLITQTQAIFFQAPTGYSADPYYRELDNTLNACGYFLQFGDAEELTFPDYVEPDWPGYKLRYRYRLMEMIQPTEDLAVYGSSDPLSWFVPFAGKYTHCRILAENVIAFVLLPKLSASEDIDATALAPNYNYNSRVPVGGQDSLERFPPDQFEARPATGGKTSASRHHQLPPLVKAVMIVIDEPSAALIQGSSSSVPPSVDLSGTSFFIHSEQLESDIQEVEKICNALPGNRKGNRQRLTYRVFTTDLMMREAKWSKD